VIRIALALSASLLAACGSDSKSAPATDAPTNNIDAQPMTIPSWQLEDIQPQSPRSGQTYGLDSFGGKIVVVTLAEGF
jgi:hypothetical protein